ncbi:hypothetical protein [Actinomadura sp. 9N215]|uniref:hypothetical protein n=1 Tax=Actinomadura sp. 9N215 TaxID=3375150 RepID=UPI00379A3922
MVELAARFSQQPGASGATVRPLMREYLGCQRLFQFAVRVLKGRLGVLQRNVEHRGEVGNGQLVPDSELQNLPRDGAQRQNRLPGHDAMVDVLLVVAGHRHIRQLVPGRQAARAFQPGDGVEPWAEPVGVAQFADVRLSHDERVAQRYLRGVSATQLKPAVGVEAVGMGVVHRGGGVGVALT